MQQTNSNLEQLAIHQVGNKAQDEVLRTSKGVSDCDDEVKSMLKNYFLQAFKTEEYYQFYHDIKLDMNEVYVCVGRIFDNPDLLFEESLHLAKHLYEQTTHPKVKGGEFYVVYFTDCAVDGETVDAIGLFKSENKENFLKVITSKDNLELNKEEGINIHKLDKGCLIFNKDRDKGFVVSVVDTTNRGTEAYYWIDDFLHVSQRCDEYFNTQNLLSLTKEFITKELPQQFEINKADQVDLLNKSVAFFKEKDEFDMNEFTQEVIAQPEVIKEFNRFKNTYEEERAINVEDHFAISDNAVKKQARVFKSVIKLDKNFHIYVHGNRELIEQGEDEQGRKYYKIYYQTEN